jgi:hypothetical protein
LIWCLSPGLGKRESCPDDNVFDAPAQSAGVAQRVCTAAGGFIGSLSASGGRCCCGSRYAANPHPLSV